VLSLIPISGSHGQLDFVPSTAVSSLCKADEFIIATVPAPPKDSDILAENTISPLLAGPIQSQISSMQSHVRTIHDSFVQRLEEAVKAERETREEALKTALKAEREKQLEALKAEREKREEALKTALKAEREKWEEALMMETDKREDERAREQAQRELEKTKAALSVKCTDLARDIIVDKSPR